MQNDVKLIVNGSDQNDELTDLSLKYNWFERIEWFEWVEWVEWVKWVELIWMIWIDLNELNDFEWFEWFEWFERFWMIWMIWIDVIKNTSLNDWTDWMADWLRLAIWLIWSAFQKLFEKNCGSNSFNSLNLTLGCAVRSPWTLSLPLSWNSSYWVQETGELYGKILTKRNLVLFRHMLALSNNMVKFTSKVESLSVMTENYSSL